MKESLKVYFLNGNFKAVKIFYAFVVIFQLNVSSQVGIDAIPPVDGCLNPSSWSVSFINSTNTAGIDHFIWTFGDGSTVTQLAADAGNIMPHTFTSAGIFEVKLVAYNPDGTTAGKGAFVTVNVYKPDDVLIGKPADPVCAGEVKFIDNSVKKAPEAGRTVSWDYGDFNVGTGDTTTHTYSFSADKFYYVKMTIHNLCGDTTAIDSIRILPLSPVIDVGGATTICGGAEINFKLSRVEPGMIYSWDFSDGSAISTEPEPIHEYTGQGSFTPSVNVKIPTGQLCDADATIDLNILPAPDPDFEMLYAPTCDSVSVLFSDATSGPVDSWQWDFGNGNTSNLQNPDNTEKYDTSGNYSVSLTATNSVNGCTNEITKTLSVPSTPYANFSANNVCVNQPAFFTDSSKIKFGSITAWNWDFGDSSTDTVQNVTHTYTSSGNKTVTLIVSAGVCADTISKNLPIEALPVINIAPLSETGCPPMIIQFNNSTSGAEKYSWNFGDGSVDTTINPLHTYINDSLHNVNYNLKFIAQTAFGCKDSTIGTYMVYQAPHSGFISDLIEKPVCVPDTVKFISTTTGPAGYTLSWNFGDNTVIPDSLTITHIFENDQHYFRYFPVSLVASTLNSCTDTAFKYVTLYPKPNTDFVIDTISSTCGTFGVQFSPPAEYLGDYTWVFEPSGETIQTGNLHLNYEFSQGPAKEDIQVKLITINQFGCSGDTTKNLTVPALPSPPIVNFTPFPSSGCPELMVSFQNLSENTDTTSYVWDFDDGTHSYEVNPTHTFLDGGSKTVTLSARGSDCSDTLKESVIEVFDMPSALFNTIPDTAWVPDNPVFCSPVYQDNNWNYSWNFGDGLSSDSMEVLHFYKDTAVYTISLVVLTDRGCSATYSKTVKGKTFGTIKSPNVFFPVAGRGGGGYGSGFGDGGGPVGDGDDIFAPVTEGVVEYHLEVYDRWGERLFHSDSKEIGWTGYYHGELCKEDVYVWKVFGKYANNVKFIKAGTITLLQQ